MKVVDSGIVYPLDVIFSCIPLISKSYRLWILTKEFGYVTAGDKLRLIESAAETFLAMIRREIDVPIILPFIPVTLLFIQEDDLGIAHPLMPCLSL